MYRQNRFTDTHPNVDDYYELASSFLKVAGKSVPIIVKHIRSFNLGESTRKEVRTMIEDAKKETLEQFTNNYINSWKNHDMFILDNLEQIRSIYEDYPNLADREVFSLATKMLEKFIENDKKVIIYTFALQPKINEVLKANHKFILMLQLSPLLSFESYLLGKVHFEFDDVARKFCYNDPKCVELRLQKLRSNTDPSDFYKILNKKQVLYDKHQRRVRNFSDYEKKVAERLLTLQHWEVFEEPYRRYGIFPGLLDYFVRDYIFLFLKKKGVIKVKNGNPLAFPQDRLLQIAKRVAR